MGETESKLEDNWKTETGLTKEEFEKFTLYFSKGNNPIDNQNRAKIYGVENGKVCNAIKDKSFDHLIYHIIGCTRYG